MKQMTSAKVRIGLDDVFFHPLNGDSPVPAKVVHAWPGMGGHGIPGVNLECCIEGDQQTYGSVPHASAVPGATGYFWTFTPKGDESPA